MPDAVQDYVKDRLRVWPQYYINFFELNQRVSKPIGAIGMLDAEAHLCSKWSYLRISAKTLYVAKGKFDFLQSME